MGTMNKIIILFLLMFYSSAKPQDKNDTTLGGFPLSIYTIESKPIERDYVLDYRIHYSQHPINDPRFNYEVKIRLKTEDNYSIPDSTIGVILQTWSGEKEKYVLNPKSYILRIDKNYYDFVFEFESDKDSFATCNLVWYDKTNNSFGPVSYNGKLLSRSFMLH
jgi:hypothetical protein